MLVSLTLLESISLLAISNGSNKHILKVAIPPYFSKINPFDCRTWLEWLLCDLVYDTITKPQPPLYYVYMVTLWAIYKMKNNDNYTQWVIVIRNNLTWSDGSKVTAYDLAFTISLFKEYPPWSSLLRPISEINVINDTAVQIISKSPIPYLLRILSSIPFLRKDEVMSTSKLSDVVYFNITSGPYIIEKFVPGKLVILKRNPYYFLKAKLLYDELELVAFPDSNSAFKALSSGEVQGIIGFASENFLKANFLKENFTFAFFPTLAVYAVIMNSERFPLSDVMLRMTIRSLIDVYNITYILLHGFVENLLLRIEGNTFTYTFLPLQLISPQYRAFSSYTQAHKASGISYNAISVKTARHTLLRLNYTDSNSDGFLEKNGTTLHLVFLAPKGDPFVEATATYISKILNLTGICTKLHLLPPHKLYVEVYLRKDFDLALIEIPFYLISNPVVVPLLIDQRAGILPIITQNITASAIAKNIDSIIFAKELNTSALLSIEKLLHSNCIVIPLFQRNSFEVFYSRLLPIKSVTSYLSLLGPENTIYTAPPHHGLGRRKYIFMITNTLSLIILIFVRRKARRLYSYEPYL